MARTAPMKANWTEQGPSQATLVIEHGGAQSFSRAVNPRAMREARKTLRGHWTVTGSTCDWVDEAKKTGADRCLSTYTFARTGA